MRQRLPDGCSGYENGEVVTVRRDHVNLQIRLPSVYPRRVLYHGENVPKEYFFHAVDCEVHVSFQCQ